MKATDIDIFARLHRANPHATSAFDVAVAMLLFRRQLPGDSTAPQVRPKDLADRLGITYDNARKALKRASAALESLGVASMQPDDNHPDDNRPVGRKASGRLSSGRPDDNHPVPSHSPYKESKGLSVCSTRAHARGGEGGADSGDSDPIPNGPSLEAEQDAVVRMVDEMTAGALLGWARAACRRWPAPWVRALVERRVIGRPIPHVGLLNSILQGWAAAGRCEYLDDSPPRAAPYRATGTDPRPRSGPSHRRPNFKGMSRAPEEQAADADEQR